jgi:hypothetical protein
MEHVESLVTVFRGFWEIFLAVAALQMGINQAVERACTEPSFTCGMLGLWYCLRFMLILLGLIFWGKLTGRGSRLVL